MSGRYLTDLADVVRRSGLACVEVGSAAGQTGDAWKSRARGSGGYSSGRPNHVMVHHTASGPGSDGWPDVNYCTFSSGDRPLCNLYLGRNGTVWVCAAGATNTNGSGHDQCGIVSDDNMNACAIGIEAGNGGTGELWPDAQLNAYTRLVKALCDAYGIGIQQVHAHWQWAPTRKVDPAGGPRYQSGGGPSPISWNMMEFCNEVQGAMPAPVPPTPTPVPPPSGGWVCPPFPGTGDYGCSSATCLAWQDAMILNGIISDNSANRDGVWGNGMHNACLNMQRSWGWSDADGVGGQHTWPHLRSRKVAPCPKCGG